MKIKKTLISTEIEFDVEELAVMDYKLRPHMKIGLLIWLKKMVGLNMVPKLIRVKKNAK